MHLIGMSTDVTPPTTPPQPPGASPPSAVATSALPDDPAVLKQMIAELIRELRRSRRDQEALQRRLDALLRRSQAPPADPKQPLLFPLADDVPEPPPATPASEEPPRRRGQTNRPHGRRRPQRTLRREQRRYELTGAERLCPDCGDER